MDHFKKQVLKISGERIRRARMLKGLSQKELATKCGYSDSTTIYKIEKGLQDIPTSKIKLLCQALDIDFDYLKGDIDYIVDYKGEAILFEGRTVDDRRAVLLRQISDRLQKASEPQLKQINGLIAVIIGGSDDGETDI